MKKFMIILLNVCMIAGSSFAMEGQEPSGDKSPKDILQNWYSTAKVKFINTSRVSQQWLTGVTQQAKAAYAGVDNSFGSALGVAGAGAGSWFSFRGLVKGGSMAERFFSKSFNGFKTPRLFGGLSLIIASLGLGTKSLIAGWEQARQIPTQYRAGQTTYCSYPQAPREIKQ